MAVGIHKLIAAISPDIYAQNPDELKKIVKEGIEKYNKAIAELKAKKIDKNDYYLYTEGLDDFYIKAAGKAKVKEFEITNNPIDFEKMMYKNAANPLSGNTAKLLKYPIETHKLTYDNFNEGLETPYFYLINLMRNLGFAKQEKVIDNFISSPGSGHFSEMGMKASRMQEEAMKMLGSANQVIKSILNLIYDLKEFKIRLGLYKMLESAKKEEKEAAIFSLKQIWLDTVDAKRGNSSIKAMALTQAGFVTLIDAFMAAENEKLEYEGSEIDLNDRVKRILKQRVLEFNLWLKESERELKKRYELEKIYLRSQYNTVQLYARWIKPYLLAAKKLEQNASERPSLVNMFNTTLFELVVFGENNPYNPEEDIVKGDLPRLFKREAYSNKRKYSSILVTEFTFTSYPERVNQNYGFRGKNEVTFSAYSLNEEEIKILKEQIKKDDFGDVVSWIENSTGQSLGALRADVNALLSDEEEKKEEKKESKEEDLNPFTSLFSFFKSEEKKKEESSQLKPIAPDSYYDKIYRAQTIHEAKQRCAKIYELYKKKLLLPTFSVLEEAF
jgi:hypothetical protein